MPPPGIPVPRQLQRIRQARAVRWVLDNDARRATAVVLAAVVFAASAFFLLGRAADFHKVLHAARHASKLWFPLCLGGEVLAYLGYVLAYHDVARADGGPKLGLWTIVRVVVIGFGAFVIASSAGGLAVDYWALREAGAAPHEAARRVLALNTLEWAVLGAWTVVAGVLILLGVGHGAPLAMVLAWIVIVPACVAAAIWTTQPGRVERLAAVPRSEAEGGRLAHRALRALRFAFADAIGGVALVRHIIAHPHRYPAGISGYCLYWFGDLLTLYAALRAFGAHADVASLVVVYSTSYVVTALPLPAGGTGGIEASLALTLSTLGFPFASAVLAVLVYRLFSFWLPILPALGFLPTVKRLKGEIDHARRSEADADSERPHV